MAAVAIEKPEDPIKFLADHLLQTVENERKKQEIEQEKRQLENEKIAYAKKLEEERQERERLEQERIRKEQELKKERENKDAKIQNDTDQALMKWEELVEEQTTARTQGKEQSMNKLEIAQVYFKDMSALVARIEEYQLPGLLADPQPVQKEEKGKEVETEEGDEEDDRGSDKHNSDSDNEQDGDARSDAESQSSHQSDNEEDSAPTHQGSPFHKVIKAALYFAGVRKTELEDWEACVEHFNMEAISALAAFNPEEPQADLAFDRAARLMQFVDEDTVSLQHFLVPILYHWIQAAVELRKRTMKLWNKESETYQEALEQVEALNEELQENEDDEDLEIYEPEFDDDASVAPDEETDEEDEPEDKPDDDEDRSDVSSDEEEYSDEEQE
eukprot:TRINITY_DN2163_c0_g1_i1.p1 TRINITY_DN2163_c0_g1~~TRINITY_DN2163_c0_g1_i1.p1  ORF type:complete len:387 (-),score=163.56 TRINITY_DN2163_c0_g1_i1:13-1173(-)